MTSSTSCHVSDAVDETRRADFFRHGGDVRRLIRGKRWLLLRSWANLDDDERATVNDLLAHNRRLARAYRSGATRSALELHLRLARTSS